MKKSIFWKKSKWNVEMAKNQFWLLPFWKRSTSVRVTCVCFDSRILCWRPLDTNRDSSPCSWCRCRPSCTRTSDTWAPPPSWRSVWRTLAKTSSPDSNYRFPFFSPWTANLNDKIIIIIIVLSQTSKQSPMDRSEIISVKYSKMARSILDIL